MGKFKKGVFLGGLLGASMMWMSTTKKGREVRDKLIDHASAVYGQVKEKAIGSDVWDTMTKNEYVMAVRQAVDKYAVQNGLADNVKGMINKLVASQYKNRKKSTRKK